MITISLTLFCAGFFTTYSAQGVANLPAPIILGKKYSLVVFFCTELKYEHIIFSITKKQLLVLPMTANNDIAV